MNKRDFISFEDYSAGELTEILTVAEWLKKTHTAGREQYYPLAGKTAALIFEKPSLRTHVSFAVGIAHLGGQSVFLSQQNIGLQTREAISDCAEVLARYNDMIIARTMLHSTVVEFGRSASVPVINALTDLLHPCQIMADALTLKERGMLTPATKIVFIGDGNNVVNSWLELAEKLPIHFVLACPEGYGPDAGILARAQAAGVSTIEIVHDPVEAARNADVLYTDVWVSMGQEEEAARRKAAFQGFQINGTLLGVAKDKCVVMHCLPAHRGEEITSEALTGPQSVVIDEAENRLHAQKAIMLHLFGKMDDARTHENSLLQALSMEYEK